jgi:predicted kinase
VNPDPISVSVSVPTANPNTSTAACTESASAAAATGSSSCDTLPSTMDSKESVVITSPVNVNRITDGDGTIGEIENVKTDDTDETEALDEDDDHNSVAATVEPQRSSGAKRAARRKRSAAAKTERVKLNAIKAKAEAEIEVERNAVRSKLSLTLMVGRQGSGKSHAASRLVETGNWISISQDEFAHLNTDEDPFAAKEACIAAVHKAFRRALTPPFDAPRHIIVDRMNFDAKQRATWTDIADSEGVDSHHCIVFQTEMKLCRTRVLERKDHPTFGPELVNAIRADIVPPAAHEGFSTISVCCTEADVDRLVRQWTVDKRPSSLLPTSVMSSSTSSVSSMLSAAALGAYQGSC